MVPDGRRPGATDADGPLSTAIGTPTAMERRRITQGPAPSRINSVWSRPNFRRILYALLVLVAVMGYGVAGYVALGWSPFDAFYMVVITISGVGFGEVRPMVTTAERVHTILVIAMGLVTVGFTVAGTVALLAEGEIQRILGHHRMRRQIDELKGHAIIAGFGRIGMLVAEELLANDQTFVIIERATERTAEAERRGYYFVQGDATEEDVLLAAGLNSARVLVSVMPNDADNVFVALTAKQIAPGVEIISRAEQPSTQKTLRQAGASHVVSPAAIGAHRIASLLTNPSLVEFAELVTNTSRLALEMDEVPIPEVSTLVGRSIAEADVRRKTNALIVAVKRRNGQLDYPPNHELPIEAGDVIVLLGRRENLDHFRSHYRA
jgi:voltage-gated potassium channel